MLRKGSIVTVVKLKPFFLFQTKLLATDCQRTHERRAAEQPKARQESLERLHERNVELKMFGFAQWNAPASLL